MSRLLTKLPRTIAPSAPIRLTNRLTTRGIVTDLDTGVNRKAKTTAGKGFISVGQPSSSSSSSAGMPTSEKGDEPLPQQFDTSVSFLNPVFLSHGYFSRFTVLKGFSRFLTVLHGASGFVTVPRISSQPPHTPYPGGPYPGAAYTH